MRTKKHIYNGGILRISKLIFAVPVFCLLTLIACQGFVEKSISVDEVTIKFDARGCMADIYEISVFPFSSVVLPAAWCEGNYTFEGWYYDSSLTAGERLGGAGDNFDVRNRDRKSNTIYARWRSEGDSVIMGIEVVRVRVDAGTFTMGSPLNEAGRYFDEEQREVRISRDFWIGKYPITNAQFGNNVQEGYEDHPAVNVDWFQALEFAERKGGSLPTEAQWEFAARGGITGKELRHIYSGSDDLDAVGWFAGNSGGETRTVGRKSPNELGIYDMSGNIYEWVYDWYGYHQDYDEPDVDPKGPSTGPGRIHRGGGWNSEARDCRVADRAYSPPSAKRNDIGFRVVFPAE